MKKCRITVMRIARYDDLIKQFENPMEHPCDMELGQVFLANGWEKPAGFCQSCLLYTSALKAPEPLRMPMPVQISR